MLKQLYHNARIIDGLGGVMERGWILIGGGNIEAVGPVNGGELPSGREIEVTDLAGRTVIPGLIDCHVHLLMEGDPDPISKARSSAEAEAALKMASNAFKTLRAGFTTVRDMGAKNFIDLHLRNAVDQGLVSGPRLFCSGQMISITGGHGAAIGLEADGVEGVRRAVRVQAGAGADWIKLMATGGVLSRGGSPGQPHYNVDELAAGVEEAHKLGLRTAAHSQSLAGSQNAVMAGIDTLEHGVGLDRELVAEMARRGTFLVPTFSAPHNIIRLGERAGIPAEFVEKTKRLLALHAAGFQLAAEAGVRIALGTDAGTPFNRHGQNARELILLAEHGLSAHQAIMCATSEGARLLGVEDLTGSLVPGRRADFLVVDGNPLDDLSLLADASKIKAVFRSGRRVRSQMETATRDQR